MSWILACSMLLVAQLHNHADAGAAASTLRLIDVTGDGQLDQLRIGHDGSITVSVNVGSKTFLSIHQQLPAVMMTDVLVSDLDADGRADLYLVSPQDNVALLGEGGGYFREATAELGLSDDGIGRSAERIDVDGDRLPDVLLHNLGGDVLFWARAPGNYERGPSTSAPGDLSLTLSALDPQLMALVLTAMGETRDQAPSLFGGRPPALEPATGGTIVPRSPGGGFASQTQGGRSGQADSGGSGGKLPPMAGQDGGGPDAGTTTDFLQVGTGSTAASGDESRLYGPLFVGEPGSQDPTILDGTLNVTDVGTLNALDVTNTAAVGTTLTVTGATTLNGGLKVNGAASGTNLTVGTGTAAAGESSILYGPLTVGTPSATKPAVFNGTLNVTDLTTLSKTPKALNVPNGLTTLVGLKVGDALATDPTLPFETFLYGPVTVQGSTTDTTLQGPLIVGDPAANAASVLNGDLTVGTPTLNTASLLNGTLGVTGPSTLSGTLGVTGKTTLSGDLDVGGATTFSSGTTFNGALTVASPFLTALEGGLSVGVGGSPQPSTFTGLLQVVAPNTAMLDGPLVVGGASTFNGTTMLNNTLTVSGTNATDLGGSLDVTGLSTLNDLTVGGVATINSHIVGGSGNTYTDFAIIGGGKNNTASGSYAAIAGGYMNQATGLRSTVGGGDNNQATAAYATVAGGSSNMATASSTTIVGGAENVASSDFSAVGGGFRNTAANSSATVSGGNDNDASGNRSTVAGGDNNDASGNRSAVGGGMGNGAVGDWSTVPGGRSNLAGGDFSFAAGRRAQASDTGSFVWADSVNMDKASSQADQFNVYASGGTRIFSNAVATSGVLLAPGGSSWSAVSDRAAKEHFEPVDVAAVLDAVSALPITTWNYKTQDDSIRHMGAMAQDFHAAFGLGVSDKLIDTIDPDGVALAAIQGLAARDHDMARRLAEKDAQITQLRASQAEMLSDLAALKAQLVELSEQR